MVECARLEIVYTGNRIKGSNPFVSARNMICFENINISCAKPRGSGAFLLRIIQCIVMFFKNLQINMAFYTLAFLGLAVWGRVKVDVSGQWQTVRPCCVTLCRTEYC